MEFGEINTAHASEGEVPELWTVMVLQTLEVMGPLHGYGIARRIDR